MQQSKWSCSMNIPRAKICEKKSVGITQVGHAIFVLIIPLFLLLENTIWPSKSTMHLSAWPCVKPCWCKVEVWHSLVQLSCCKFLLIFFVILLNYLFCYVIFLCSCEYVFIWTRQRSNFILFVIFFLLIIIILCICFHFFILFLFLILIIIIIIIISSIDNIVILYIYIYTYKSSFFFFNFVHPSYSIFLNCIYLNRCVHFFV